MRRFTGKNVSNHKATTEHRQGLNIAQENVLVGHTQRFVQRTLALSLFGGRHNP